MKKINEKSKYIIKLNLLILSIVISVFALSNNGLTYALDNSEWKIWGDKWEHFKEDKTNLCITPGKNETELNFAWYSNLNERNPKVKFSKNKNMSNCKEFIGVSINAINGYNSNKVTITGLEENETYYYSYGNNNIFGSPIKYKTKKIDNFSIFLVGDPQIGASKSKHKENQAQVNAVKNDSFNWNNTLKKALELNPNASFMISVGDQIQSGSTSNINTNNMQNEIEYTGFLCPKYLKQLPIATTIGNHDNCSSNYSFHFNNPNTCNLGLTISGGDYYFTYRNSLFIMLNTNNNNVKEHDLVIKKAIKENIDKKWRVVTMHHDIYGSGKHSNDSYILNLRKNLVPIFEKNKIDVVLTGHDHTYARSKRLTSGKVDENGILYITCNSSSGSKYYKNCENKQYYVENRWQKNVPTFSIIDIDNKNFTINTYRTDTMKKIDKTCIIVK